MNEESEAAHRAETEKAGGLILISTAQGQNHDKDIATLMTYLGDGEAE